MINDIRTALAAAGLGAIAGQGTAVAQETPGGATGMQPSAGSARYVQLSFGTADFGSPDFGIPQGRIALGTETGASVRGSVGWTLTDTVSAEVFGGWTSAGISDARRSGGGIIPLIYQEPGDITAVSLGARLSYDLPAIGTLTPYIGLGVGLSNLTFDDGFVAEGDGAGWMGEARAGFRAPLATGTAGFVEVRQEMYASGGREGMWSGKSGDVDMSATTVAAGVSVAF